MKKQYLIISGIFGFCILAFFVARHFYKKQMLESVVTIPSEMLVRDYSPALGPEVARTVLVEFLDPECEACRAMHPIVKEVLNKFDGQIRYVVRYMPFHGNSALAIKWLEASRKQGKYWEAMDSLFENQPVWGDHHSPRGDLIPSLIQLAGVSMPEAQAVLNDPQVEAWINQDFADGQKLGVRGTPTFFVNGKKLLEIGYAPLVNAIESEVAESR